MTTGTVSIERPPMSTEDRKPAWRRACPAYREMRQAGASDQEAHEAAVEAAQAVFHRLGKWSASKLSTLSPTRPVITQSGFCKGRSMSGMASVSLGAEAWGST